MAIVISTKAVKRICDFSVRSLDPAELRSSAFLLVWVAIDRLDRREYVFRLIEVDISLDLVGLESHPDVMYFSQPLLHKAMALVEGRFVRIGWMVEVGSVEPVRFGEQVADGSGVVVKSFLMLATCTTEDVQGNRVGDVAQLTPPSLHSGIFVRAW
ncbi:hypothetical protein SprV_0100231300 [Sparganum proliferum]